MGYRDNCSNDEAAEFDRGIEESQRYNKYTDELYEEIRQLRVENTRLKKELKSIKRKSS